MVTPYREIEMYPIILAILLAFLRVVGLKHQAFQAVSHIYVGYIFTASWFDKQNRKQYFWLGVAVSLVELAVFLKDRFL
jgi:hypothetical protein